VPPASAKSAESAAEWLVEQARSKNEHMHSAICSAVSFFGREVPRNGVDENVFDAACSDDVDVSKQAKADITK
jgi:hypothetical protein